MRAAQVLQHDPTNPLMPDLPRTEPYAEQPHAHAGERDVDPGEASKIHVARDHPRGADRDGHGDARETRRTKPEPGTLYSRHADANLPRNLAQHVRRNNAAAMQQVHHDRVELGYRATTSIRDAPGLLILAGFVRSHCHSLFTIALWCAVHTQRRLRNLQRARVCSIVSDKRPPVDYDTGAELESPDVTVFWRRCV